MNRRSNFLSVMDFNIAFGVSVSEKMTPFVDKHIREIFTNKDLVDLRFSLIQEEVNELFDAYNENNLTEILDALTDILYVVYGAGVSFGIDLDKSYKNYLKNKIILCGNNTSTDTYINRSADFTLSNFETTCELNGNPKNYWAHTHHIFKYLGFHVKYRILNIMYTTSNLKIDIQVEDYNSMMKNLNHLLYLTYSLGHVLHMNLNESFDIVHHSNMTKLCCSEEEAQNTVNNYKENDNRYDSPEYRQSDLGDYYVVFNKSTGKILKSINYLPADFSKLLTTKEVIETSNE
jgi:predicted HAD superfamily Cof-like phosphohydrolase